MEGVVWAEGDDELRHSRVISDAIFRALQTSCSRYVVAAPRVCRRDIMLVKLKHDDDIDVDGDCAVYSSEGFQLVIRVLGAALRAVERARDAGTDHSEAVLWFLAFLHALPPALAALRNHAVRHFLESVDLHLQTAEDLQGTIEEYRERFNMRLWNLDLDKDERGIVFLMRSLDLPSDYIYNHITQVVQAKPDGSDDDDLMGTPDVDVANPLGSPNNDDDGE
jgi:hypothetical protein